MQSVRCLAVVLALSTPLAALAATTAGHSAGGLTLSPGVFKCELNKSVHVQKVSDDRTSAVLKWENRDYTMRAVNTNTGALRYEDSKTGMVWLMISGKSMLLNAKQGQRLADECRS